MCYVHTQTDMAKQLIMAHTIIFRKKCYYVDTQTDMAKQILLLNMPDIYL